MADFCKFDNFRRFFRHNLAKNCCSDLLKSGKDASWWDLKLSTNEFSSKMNSWAVILEKPEKMAKIADFAHFETLWSLNANFAGHLFCGKMLGIWSSLTCRSTRWGCLAALGPTKDFISSPQLMHNPHYTFSYWRKLLVPPN